MILDVFAHRIRHITGRSVDLTLWTTSWGFVAGMLETDDLARVQGLITSGASRPVLRDEVERIRQGLNPHPAQQKELNVPRLGDREVPGMQHKYRETVLFFPAEGQVC